MIDHFSFLASVYDRLIKPPDLTEVRDLLNLPLDGKLLDAGGGTGRLSAGLRTSTGTTVVCDLSQPMLKKAREKGGLSTVQAKTETLPFPDGCFDGILVVDALHHFRHPKESIRELLRVLKPGGRLVIDEFDASLLSVKLIALAEKLALMGSRFFKPEEIVAMIADCGFPAEVRENGKTSFWVVVEKGGI